MSTSLDLATVKTSRGPERPPLVVAHAAGRVRHIDPECSPAWKLCGSLSRRDPTWIGSDGAARRRLANYSPTSASVASGAARSAPDATRDPRHQPELLALYPGS